VRTTIRLDDDLARELKQIAARNGRTFADVVDEALRESLARRRGGAELPAPDLPVFHGTGLQPGVDLDDSASLLDVMEGRG